MKPGKTVFLVGPRGSGKTTIGRLLAGIIGADFADTDDMVREAAGATIAELFAREGEAGFRTRESAAVASAAAMRNAVVALGGGAVEDQANVRLIRESGVVVRLKAAPLTLFRRTSADPDSMSCRPALTGLDPLQEITVTVARREGAYAAAAHFSLDTDSLPPDRAAEEISRMIG